MNGDHVPAALIAFATLSVLAAAALGQAEERAGYTDTPMLPGGQWHVHDPARPYPPFVDPGPVPDRPAPAPSDAIVLFDGTDLTKWLTLDGKVPAWILRDGCATIPPHDTPNGGDMRTKEEYGDCQLHLEFSLPERVAGEEHSFNRGNSGVFLLGLYELQIFDSYRYNYLYADGVCAAMYGQFPPSVNVTRKPGEWQSYDVLFSAPRLKDGKVDAPACITVFHNGVCVHNHQALLGPTGHRILASYGTNPAVRGPLTLQAHGAAVRFRNIWIRMM